MNAPTPAPLSESSERQPNGQWCWCADSPEDQQPHDCAEDHPMRSQCHADGAHVHPVSTRRASRPKPDTIKMDVPRKLHPRILAIRDDIHAQTGLSTTLPDTWQALVEYWEQGHQ